MAIIKKKKKKWWKKKREEGRREKGKGVRTEDNRGRPALVQFITRCGKEPQRETDNLFLFSSPISRKYTRIHNES